MWYTKFPLRKLLHCRTSVEPTGSTHQFETYFKRTSPYVNEYFECQTQQGCLNIRKQIKHQLINCISSTKRLIILVNCRIK